MAAIGFNKWDEFEQDLADALGAQDQEAPHPQLRCSAPGFGASSAGAAQARWPARPAPTQAAPAAASAPRAVRQSPRAAMMPVPTPACMAPAFAAFPESAVAGFSMGARLNASAAGTDEEASLELARQLQAEADAESIEVARRMQAEADAAATAAAARRLQAENEAAANIAVARRLQAESDAEYARLLEQEHASGQADAHRTAQAHGPPSSSSSSPQPRPARRQAPQVNFEPLLRPRSMGGDLVRADEAAGAADTGDATSSASGSTATRWREQFRDYIGATTEGERLNRWRPSGQQRRPRHSGEHFEPGEYQPDEQEEAEDEEEERLNRQFWSSQAGRSPDRPRQRAERADDTTDWGAEQWRRHAERAAEAVSSTNAAHLNAQYRRAAADQAARRRGVPSHPSSSRSTSPETRHPPQRRVRYGDPGYNGIDWNESEFTRPSNTPAYQGDVLDSSSSSRSSSPSPARRVIHVPAAWPRVSAARRSTASSAAAPQSGGQGQGPDRGAASGRGASGRGSAGRGSAGRGSRDSALNSRTVVASFTAPPPGSDDAMLECSICMEKFEEGDQLRTLPCLHKYHVTCIDRWLTSSRQCPTCRHDVL